MVNMPEYAKVETILFRYIKRFHEQFLNRMGPSSKETLKGTAWQIEEYLEENGKYKDADFLRTIQATLEYYIQKKSKSESGAKWSVARAKKDMRGRGTGINQYSKNKPPRKRAPVPIKLSRSIDNRLLDIPRREFGD